MPGIYKITNKVNGKMYIGKTKSVFKKRWSSHKSYLRKGTSGCCILQYAWNKYGEENFDFSVIAEGDFNQEELKQLEEIFIKLYGNYNVEKVSKDLPQSKAKSQKLSKASKKRWANAEWREKQIAAITSDAWELYSQVVDFWRDKSNGRGGCNHPGTVEIQHKFNLSRSIVDRMLLKIKEDSSIQTIEAYNKEEIYKFWLNSNNVGQSKYNHPGKRIISKQFNISDVRAQSLIKEFRQRANSTTTKTYDKDIIYLDWKDNQITYKDIMSKYNLGRTKAYTLIKEFKQK